MQWSNGGRGGPTCRRDSNLWKYDTHGDTEVTVQHTNSSQIQPDLIELVQLLPIFLTENASETLFSWWNLFLQHTEAIQKEIFGLGASQWLISHRHWRTFKSVCHLSSGQEACWKEWAAVWCLFSAWWPHFAPLVWVPKYSVGINGGLLVTSENTWNNSIYGMTVAYTKHVQLHSQKHWSTNGRWKTQPGIHLVLLFLHLRRQSINSSDTNPVKHTIGAALQPKPKTSWCLIQYLESEMRWKRAWAFKYVHSGSLSKATWK